MTFVRLLVGRWRFWWGFCPACNSDAPAIDSCPICRAGFRYLHEGGGKHDADRWQRFISEQKQ